LQALHNATDIRNASTNIKGKQTPIALFSNIDTEPKLRDFHPFGSPVYVLDDTMQSRQKLSKWKEKTGVGVNFCQSPSHGQSVSLVLNFLTGLEYHILHDDKFEIVKGTCSQFTMAMPERVQTITPHTFRKWISSKYRFIRSWNFSIFLKSPEITKARNNNSN
jgi:hypothetical protein